MTVLNWVEEYEHYSIVEQRTKLKLGSLLGCGAYGAVFSTNDESKVIKITSDHNELILASKVMDIRRADTRKGVGPSDYLSGLVFLFGIYDLPSTYVQKFDKDTNIYAIVREAVTPVVNYSDYIPNYKNIYRILDKIHDAAADFHSSSGNVHSYEDTEKYMRMVYELEEYCPYLATTFMELVRYGIIMKDTHAGNVGVSILDWGSDYRAPGELVVFDLGFTPTSGDYDLEIR